MKHSFFKNVDFKKILNKWEEPEWKPVLKDQYDVDNFDREFTTMGKFFYVLNLEPKETFIQKKKEKRNNEIDFQDFEFKGNT